MTTPTCPYCNVPAKLKSDDQIYGRSYGGHVWYCETCDARVGCHPGTKEPLGTMANAALRKARMATHALFDQLWNYERMPRHRSRLRYECYQWLANQLGIDIDDCHIGHFDEERCRQAMELARVKLKTHELKA